MKTGLCYDEMQKIAKGEVMISYIKGPLMEIDGDLIVIEAGNIGFGIRVPLSLLDELPKVGETVRVYTYFQVREDAMSLYGFLHRQDREMFKQLLGVNGVGPKGALGILSALRPDALRMAIISGDVKAISKAPGIGSKTAQRVILDLKDKISSEDLFPAAGDGGFLENSGIQSGIDGYGDASREAVSALVALGYSNMEAARAVKKAEITDDMTTEDVLKASLRHLSFL